MRVYLDNNSTTAVDKRVLEKMLPYFSEKFGNAASKSHAFGWEAEEAVDNARQEIAKMIGSEANEIIFTSGSTESINLSLKGIAEAYFTKGKHIVTVATEHKAVLDTCNHLQKQGYEISVLPVMHDGTIDLNILRDSIRKDTILVSVMLANNETGVIHPLKEISKIVHEKESILFSDATQAAGKIGTDVNENGVDLLCLSAHKFYGPKGTGALYIRRKNPRVKLLPQINGGGHEKNLRSGTLNVPGIVGLGEACKILNENFISEIKRIADFQHKIEVSLIATGKVSVNGNIKNRLPNTSNLMFHHWKAENLIHKLPDIALATGSACSSALPQPSHVLLAMGLTNEEAYSSIRISTGRFTTIEEIEYAIESFRNLL
jgi:cysteine desulfurase